MRYLLAVFLFCISSFASYLELDGVVESENEKIISSRMMGYITKVYVSEGDIVKKGQLLYEIDPTDIAYNEKIVRSQVSNLEINLKRYKELLEQDLVSKFDYEQLELNLITAKAKLAELTANYNYLKVKAPNNAMLIKKSIKEAEMAIPGMPHLILTDLDSLIIKTNISESNLKNISVGKKVKIEIASQNFRTDGVVKAIYPSYMNSTHSFVVKISFDKKEFNIYPAMYARITLFLDEDLEKTDE
ncbi:Cobalt-zinc-cadmium resistance protein CzcB [Aliarcobacter thereius]|uniref:Efflux RND transporter periplasmic adaptor subunit n=1 Tax=Aliarcobacter thereius TaxID=544718 RepID=A0A5R9GZZ5_9BACT|nr:efflux RND transporter periplasmic adaptor subunit [Aliarcobacter thereius]OCL86397.1 Cobalt-zinc-cadmium resistance protein CzcB [Aliarcobacter thereius]TLS71423.1 efflux RND transporter periplasmic adaptor subunit [Aliarcobacter thereius]